MRDEVEQRAVASAVAVAAARGVRSIDASIIYSGSNILVHLRPQPVVARVMSGTVALHDDPRKWLEREVSILRFLARTGLAVRPSRKLPPGPHHYDGLWMTFTEWVPNVQPGPEQDSGVSRDDARGLGRMLRRLHDALRSCDEKLPGLSELRGDIERLADQLRPADAAQRERIASLRNELTRLGSAVFDSTLPTQALHGDVSLRNLLQTPAGPVWNDFEDTFRGPVHWDLASAVGSLRGHGADPQTISDMLDAYGWQDEPALSPFSDVQDVYDEIWQMYDQQRRS